MVIEVTAVRVRSHQSAVGLFRDLGVLVYLLVLEFDLQELLIRVVADASEQRGRNGFPVHTCG